MACVWSRDVGRQNGHHIHLALYWPLEMEMLIQLLERLTGAPRQAPQRPNHKTIARGEMGAWQIDQNVARNAVKSAMTWMHYLETQAARHATPATIDGFDVGFSESLGFKAMAPHRTSLQAYKVTYGWSDTPAAASWTQR